MGDVVMFGGVRRCGGALKVGLCSGLIRLQSCSLMGAGPNSFCAAVPSPLRRENNTGRFPRGLSLMLRSMAGEGTVYCLWGWPGLLCTA